MDVYVYVYHNDTTTYVRTTTTIIIIISCLYPMCTAGPCDPETFSLPVSYLYLNTAIEDTMLQPGQTVAICNPRAIAGGPHGGGGGNRGGKEGEGWVIGGGGGGGGGTGMGHDAFCIFIFCFVLKLESLYM